MLNQKLTSLERGSHPLAKQHVEFLCGKLVDMIEKGKCMLFPAKLILHNPNLRLSPLEGWCLSVIEDLGLFTKTLFSDQQRHG
jgi:hypothetical protein